MPSPSPPPDPDLEGRPVFTMTAQTSTTSSSAGKPRKRAQRVQLACTACREGKMKCNREYPACDQCFKRSKESTCTYTERGLRYNTARSKAEGMREKIARLEAFVSRIKEARDEENDEHEGGEEVGDEDETRAEWSAECEATFKDGGLVPLTGNLRLSGSGGTQYVGPTHWESIIEDEIADVKAYFDLESEPDAVSSKGSSPVPNSTVPQADIIQGVSCIFTKQELLGFLPARQEVDRPIASWFNASEPLRLILHAQTFQREYQVFWTDPPSVSPAWLALLFAICGIGAEISGQLRRDTGSVLRAEDFRRLASHALILSDYLSKPQPYVIEAIQLQVKSLLLKHHDTTPASWLLHGQVMRMLYFAGYHRDPGSNPAISPFDCEMRRRVWMFACEYDVLMSYQLGMVSWLNRSMYDTKLPANLRCADFSPDQVPPSRSHEEYTPILMELYHIRLVEVYGEIVALSHTFDPSGKQDLMNLHARLDKIWNGLPRVLRPVSISDAFMDPPELILDRFRLQSLYLRGLCVLYRPFVGEPGQHEGKRRCLDAALQIVECQLPVLDAARPGGQIARSAVFMARHVHDFNFAAMLLCYDLKRSSQADSDEVRCVDQNRVRSSILQACASYKVLGVTSPKARHALRAMELFLLSLQVAQTHASAADLASGNGEVGASAGQEGRMAQHYMSSSMSMPANGGFDLMAASSSHGGYPTDASSIEQDPLFRELFGPATAAAIPPQPIMPTFKDQIF